VFKDLGFSVYVSAFARQKQMLAALAATDTVVFTSFHIQEEFDETYVSQALAMCHWLKEAGFRIMGDVSPKTLSRFGHSDILGFAREARLDFLRLDYGFELEEILSIARVFPIAFNASTGDAATAKEIVKTGGKVYAMHNFYPRPETGLDSIQFAKINSQLRQLGIEVLAFIPGDTEKRGPICDGLPTMEQHRRIPPYVSYVDMAINHQVDGIFLGDLGLSPSQLQLIQEFCQSGVIAIPTRLTSQYQYLYNQTFTIRPDSPLGLKRLQESREYSCPGPPIEPNNCRQRAYGSITMDNHLYGRYSGEIQILCQDLPQDDRVNIIGEVEPEYVALLPCLTNGKKLKLIKF